MMKDSRAKWTVNTNIEKYNDAESLKSGIPDEVLNFPGNALLNEGINAIWALVSGAYRSDASYEKEPSAADYGIDLNKGVNGTGIEQAFDHTHSFIGIGSSQAAFQATSNGLDAVQNSSSAGAIYMGMDTGYPLAGFDQKIIFRSTFKPGVACFSWYEWTIANGNCNGSDTTSRSDTIITASPDGGETPPPNPIPTEADGAYAIPASGTMQENQATHINLNRKQENMGLKYTSATWIVTVELSLT